MILFISVIVIVVIISVPWASGARSFLRLSSSDGLILGFNLVSQWVFGVSAMVLKLYLTGCAQVFFLLARGVQISH